MYLYIAYDSDACQDDKPPSKEDIENCVEGLGEIYRFHDGLFQVLTPIDNQDTENWTTIERRD